MSSKENAKLSLCKTSTKLNKLSLNHGATGNCSIREVAGFLITPSGINNEHLNEGHIIKVAMDGTPEKNQSNQLSPSSEWRFHRDIYVHRPDVQAIVHTHSIHASTLSVLGKPIPPFHYMIAVTGGKQINCADYAMFGTQKLSDNIISALGIHKACLLSNHGLVAVGKDLQEAFDIAEEVEHLSQMYIQAKIIGEPNLLSDKEMDEVLGRFKSYGRWEKE
tara:strand:- start:2635 stop:3294 length:660 start_codon:yes stop_codon:yes gene_type:complete